MPKKSFREISSQAARAFITTETVVEEAVAVPTVEEAAMMEKAVVAETAKVPRRAGRPRENKRVITKSSQESLPENWTRATFIVREDLLDRLKQYSTRQEITIKQAVNAALEGYLEGGKADD